MNKVRINMAEQNKEHSDSALSESRTEAEKPFRKVFDEQGDFAASVAEKWLRDHGYSVGTMQRGSPRGIMLGDCDISKWLNLSRRDVAELDGELTGDGRNGPVTVKLKRAPEST